MLAAAAAGATLGFATGYFFKKVGRMMLIFIGAEFVFLQTLAMLGYVDVHWSRIVAADGDPRAGAHALVVCVRARAPG